MCPKVLRKVGQVSVDKAPELRTSLETPRFAAVFYSVVNDQEIPISCLRHIVRTLVKTRILTELDRSFGLCRLFCHQVHAHLVRYGSIFNLADP